MCHSGAWGELCISEQGHSNRSAFQSAGDADTTEELSETVFFHSNCGDGGGLRIVLGINLRYIINTLLRKTLLNLLDQSVTYGGEIMGIS